MSSYQQRLAQEQAAYKNCEEVHNLPEIFHYWSNRYVRPKLETFGFSTPDDLFVKHLDRLLRERRSGTLRFISLGSGNCDLEVATAQKLRNAGHHHFILECLDLNEDMLRRGKDSAVQNGVADAVAFVRGDFNEWTPAGSYDAVMVNQALHHVVQLEKLLDSVKVSLNAGGRFITSDMIGRNGHQRWPEALAIVNEYWQELPAAHRYNQQLRRYEEQFQDWDCSKEGFEGIRSQDILPLLLDRFHFHLFIAFGNVIDPFVDRSFGHNFNASADWDKSFVDRVHNRDEAEMRAGRIKPTHMLAVMGNEPASELEHLAPFTPEFSVRRP